MNETSTTTPDKILSAAEDEFIEKGYGNARMMSIAARAGVSHSMLHYYYRSKEELFQKVFNSKAELLSKIITGLYDDESDFLCIVKGFTEKQFDAFMESPRFVMFIVRDIITVRDNLQRLVYIAKTKFSSHFLHIQTMLDKEIAAGRVRPIDLTNLIINIVALNMNTILSIPVLKEVCDGFDEAKYLEERKKSNVEFVLSSLRP